MSNQIIDVVDDPSESKPELRFFFSLLTGEIYSVEADEVEHLGEDQIPLKKRPDTRCKKCYGRFYVGRKHIRNYETNEWEFVHYIPCPRCARKYLDLDKLKNQTFRVERMQDVTRSFPSGGASQVQSESHTPRDR